MLLPVGVLLVFLLSLFLDLPPAVPVLLVVLFLFRTLKIPTPPVLTSAALLA